MPGACHFLQLPSASWIYTPPPLLRRIQESLSCPETQQASSLFLRVPDKTNSIYINCDQTIFDAMLCTQGFRHLKVISCHSSDHICCVWSVLCKIHTYLDNVCCRYIDFFPIFTDWLDFWAWLFGHLLFWVSYMYEFCIFVFALVQRSWAWFTWKGALEIQLLLLLFSHLSQMEVIPSIYIQ